MALSYWHRTLALAALAFSALTIPAFADDHLDTMRIGSTTYSNVTVMTKTSSDLFFKHSFGFGNVKVREVDRKTLLALGYQLPPDESESKSVFTQSAQSVMESSAVTNFVADPRVQEAQALMTAQLGDFVEKLTPQLLYGITAGIIALYLFCCFCCRQICVKSGKAASPLIWVPFLQLFPLLRAANIPWWWLIPVVLLFPIGLPILYIVWAFRIVQARGKNWAMGLLLILPFLNVLAFLYLAFSGVGKADPGNSNVISLGNPPPRRAVA